MLKSLGAFLLLFWFLSLVVHAGGLAQFFGWSAVAIFVTDLLISPLKLTLKSSRVRRQTII